MKFVRARKRAGFTLIELLVVVVIIGILASVALPSFVGAQDKARNATVQSNVKMVQTCIEQYAADNNGLYLGGFNATTGLTFYPGGGSAPDFKPYIAGGTLPCSPWCKQGQNNFVGLTSTTLTTAVNVTAGTPLPTLNGYFLTPATLPGSVPTTSAYTNRNFGTLFYDLDPGSEVYVLYGAGKKGDKPVVCSSASNGGG